MNLAVVYNQGVAQGEEEEDTAQQQATDSDAEVPAAQSRGGKRGRKGEECIQDGGGAERLKRGISGCSLGDSTQETHERAGHAHALQQQQQREAAAAAAAA